MKKVIRGVEKTLIKTPKIVERAKKYFNCDSLEGLELEDQGDQGSSISHWEQRILLGDYIGAAIYQEEMAISEFTLAFLEDSGWYKPKYYTGELLRFGKNKGCDFINNDCLDSNLKANFKNEFLIKSMEVVQLEDKVELIQFFTHIKILKMIYIKDLEIIIMVEQYIQ